MRKKKSFIKTFLYIRYEIVWPIVRQCIISLVIFLIYFVIIKVIIIILDFIYPSLLMLPSFNEYTNRIYWKWRFSDFYTNMEFFILSVIASLICLGNSILKLFHPHQSTSTTTHSIEMVKETEALVIQNIQTLAEETEQPLIKIERVDEESVLFLPNEFKKTIIKNTEKAIVEPSVDVSDFYAKPTLDLSQYGLPGFKLPDVYNNSLKKKPEILIDDYESKLWEEMSTLIKECVLTNPSDQTTELEIWVDDFVINFWLDKSNQEAVEKFWNAFGNTFREVRYKEFKSKFAEWSQSKIKSRDLDNNIGTFTENYCALENSATLEKLLIESKKLLSDFQQTLKETAPVTITKDISNNVNHHIVYNKDVNITYTNFIDIYASLVASPSSLFLVFFFMPVFLYVIYFTCKFLSFRSKK